MSDIIMFRSISGEDIIAELVFEDDKNVKVKNVIQLMVVPSKTNPQDVNYGFAAYPQYARPKSDAIISFNRDNIVFFIDVDPDFLDQYKMVFGHFVTPSPQIFTGI